MNLPDWLLEKITIMDWVKLTTAGIFVRLVFRSIRGLPEEFKSRIRREAFNNYFNRN